MTTLSDLQQAADDWHDRHMRGLELAFDRIETLRRVADRVCEDETAIHALSACEATAVNIAVTTIVAAHWHVTAEQTFRSELAQRN